VPSFAASDQRQEQPHQEGVGFEIARRLDAGAVAVRVENEVEESLDRGVLAGMERPATRRFEGRGVRDARHTPARDSGEDADIATVMKS